MAVRAWYVARAAVPITCEVQTTREWHIAMSERVSYTTHALHLRPGTQSNAQPYHAARVQSLRKSHVNQSNGVIESL